MAACPSAVRKSMTTDRLPRLQEWKYAASVLADERRSPFARVIAFGRFNLDDIRAEVRENLARPRTSQNPRELDDFEVR